MDSAWIVRALFTGLLTLPKECNIVKRSISSVSFRAREESRPLININTLFGFFSRYAHSQIENYTNSMTLFDRLRRQPKLYHFIILSLCNFMIFKITNDLPYSVKLFSLEHF